MLQQLGIKSLSPADIQAAVSDPEFRKVFDVVLSDGRGRGDAAFAAFAKSTGYESITFDAKLLRSMSGHLKLNIPNLWAVNGKGIAEVFKWCP